MCSKTEHNFKKIKIVITLVKKLKCVHTIVTDGIELPSLSYKRYCSIISFIDVLKNKLNIGMLY